jgi:hypothetical protein
VLLVRRWGARLLKRCEAGKMSNGLSQRAARRDPDGSARLARWQQGESSAASDAASDTVTGLPFMQVELPSRRWYIEAAGDRAAAE